MYLFALFNSDSVKQKDQIFNTRKYVVNSTNVKITVCITVYSITIPPTYASLKSILIFTFSIILYDLQKVCFIVGT